MSTSEICSMMNFLLISASAFKQVFDHWGRLRLTENGKSCGVPGGKGGGWARKRRQHALYSANSSQSERETSATSSLRMPYVAPQPPERCTESTYCGQGICTTAQPSKKEKKTKMLSLLQSWCQLLRAPSRDCTRWVQFIWWLVRDTGDICAMFRFTGRAWISPDGSPTNVGDTWMSDQTTDSSMRWRTMR